MMKSSASSDFKETRTNSCTQPSELRPSHTEPTIDERRLIRRIDWRLLPVLCTVYVIQFMDKVILNYANVMGIQKQLHMTLNQFVWSGTAFFLGFLIAEIPQGIIDPLTTMKNDSCKLTSVRGISSILLSQQSPRRECLSMGHSHCFHSFRSKRSPVTRPSYSSRCPRVRHTAGSHYNYSGMV
jgi:hypothetical protein